MAKIECVTDQDLKAFLLGDLPERVADTIARHLESCADCLQRTSRYHPPDANQTRRCAKQYAIITNGKNDCHILDHY